MLAFILAAGFGTRFRPATLTTPKPLLPFLGKPILLHLFDHLIAQGVDRFVVNTHHLGEKLIAAVGGAYEGCPIAYSPEDPILGTAGAIRRAAERGLLADEPFVVANGDVFTSLGLGRLLRARQETNVVSALAVLPNLSPEKETPLWANPEGRLIGVGGESPSPDATGPWLFTGIQDARPELARRVPPGVAELARDVLVPSVAANERSFALVAYRVPEEGLWFDLGSPERLAAAEREVKTLTSSGGPTSSSAPSTPGPGSSRSSA